MSTKQGIVLKNSKVFPLLEALKLLVVANDRLLITVDCTQLGRYLIYVNFLANDSLLEVASLPVPLARCVIS